MKAFLDRRWTATIVLLCGLCGCAALKPARATTDFYLLDAPAPSAPRQPRGQLTVRVLPVDTAFYLKTEDIVLRTGENQVEFARMHQWGEPLSEGIRRVLAEDLRNQNEISQVLTDEPLRSSAHAYLIFVTVLACDGIQSGSGSAVQFEALWEITAPNGKITRGEFRPPRTPWNGTDYANLARTISREVRDLAGAVAKAALEIRNGQ